MVESKTGQYTLACLAATASVLGCVAISVATMAHAQVATPRFYAKVPVIRAAHPCLANCSAVVISR